MKHLAQATVEYILLLSTSGQESLDPRLAERTLVPLLDDLADASPAEKAALALAAHETLAFMTREPDEYGYTPRDLVTQKGRDILGAIEEGTIFLRE